MKDLRNNWINSINRGYVLTEDFSQEAINGESLAGRQAQNSAARQSDEMTSDIDEYEMIQKFEKENAEKLAQDNALADTHSVKENKTDTGSAENPQNTENTPDPDNKQDVQVDQNNIQA